MSTDYAHDTTLKLGEHRGNRRVWIEGQTLARAGFAPSDAIRATFEAGRIIIERDPTGERTVSGRTRNGRALPIIDICAGQVANSLGDVPCIAVKIRHHRIVIEPSRVSGMVAARVMTAIAVGVFAGGGLLSEAARAAGFRTVAAVEVSPDFAEIHERNHGGHSCVQCVSEADFHALRASYGPIGLLHAGIPCEPFSVIRRNAGDNTKTARSTPEAHEHGDMTFWALRAVDILNPHTVVFEQVPGWLDSGAGWIARHTLARLGYTVDARIIDSAAHGALTSRKRAVLVATAYPSVRWPEPVARVASLSDILHAPDDPRCEWFDRAGKGWLFDHWDKQTAKGNGFASDVIRYGQTTAPTIKKRYFAGQGDNPVVAHPDRPGVYRWLTLAEVAAIMGLPPSYDLGDTKTHAGEVLGQGVEVRTFTAIINSITDHA